MPVWELPLRAAAKVIREVVQEAWEAAHDSDQFDNAADDGALASRLALAVELIEKELPESGGP